jgi:ATP-binding cassette subfamily B protein
MVWEAYPLGVMVVTGLAIVGGGLPALGLYASKGVIDGLTTWIAGDAAAGRSLVIWFLGLALVVMIGLAVITQLRGFFERMLQLRLTNRIQRKIIDQACALDLSFFESPEFFDKLQRARREAGVRPLATLRSTVGIVSVLTSLSSYIIVLATLDWRLAPMVLLVAVPGFLVETRYGLLGYYIFHRRTPEERMRGYLEEILTSNYHAKEIRLFGLAEYLIKRWRKLFERFYKQDLDHARRRMFAETAVTLTETTAWVGFIVYLIYRTVTDPAVTIGSFVMYKGAVERSIGATSSAYNQVADLYNNSLYLRNLFDFLELRPSITVPQQCAAIPTPMDRGITFEQVSFAYPRTERQVIKNVSFSIHPGERIAIVGENGAGKTTLIKLLSRLYDCTDGRILLDGIDIRSVDPAAWQKQIGVIFQDYARYDLTARENVGFGQIESVNDIERIDGAARLSGASDMVAEFERGWESMLGKRFDGGVELSGGEWQRIALARAFLRNAQILVLDEPTSSLDAKQEHEVFVKFNDLANGKTTILISHRFSTVRAVDRILVVEQGRIVENGSHYELMHKNGRYAELFNLQAQHYQQPRGSDNTSILRYQET